MNRLAWLWLGMILALAAAGCTEAPLPPARREAPVAVRTAVLAPESVERSYRAPGSIEPWARTSPGSKILGRIEAVPVREGDRIERNALLARLESRDLEAAVAQARAAVAMAEAGLENAAAQRRRMEGLHARGSATEKGLEDAVAQHRTAAAALEQARAGLDAAEVALSYAEIRSPVAGFVVARHAEAGDMAAPGRPLFTVEDLSRVKVSVSVPENVVVGLAAGGPAVIEVDVLEAEIEGRIHRIVPAGDPSSRTFEVKLLLDNPGTRLKSGMFARARFPVGAEETLRIPSGAVVARGQLRGVFVVEKDGRARLRWIRLGREEGGQVEVLSGLRPGDRYLPDPPPGFADATPVQEG